MNESRLPPTAPQGRRRLLTVGILSAGMVLGVCASMVLGRLNSLHGGPFYETTAQVRLDLHLANDQVGQASPVITEQDAQTWAQLLKSNQVLQRAVDEYRLDELTSFANLPPQQVAAKIDESLTTHVVPGPRRAEAALVDLTYRSSGAVDVVTVVKAVIRAYRDQLGDAAKSADGDNLQKMTDDADEIAAGLKLQREALQKLRLGAPSLPPAEDPGHPEQRRSRLQQELRTLDFRRAALKALQTTADDAKQAGKTPAVIGQLLRRDELFRNASRPAVPPAPEKPTLPRITIDDDQSLSVLVRQLTDELSRLEHQRRELEQRLKMADREAASVRDFTTQLRLLEDEIKEQESLQASLQTRRHEMERATGMRTPSIEIVQQPDSPREVRAAWPALFSAEVGAGASLGLLLGFVGVTFYFAFVPQEV